MTAHDLRPRPRSRRRRRRARSRLQLAGAPRAQRRTVACWIGRLGARRRRHRRLAVVHHRAGWVDQFFYGQPSGIWDSLVRLFTKGTAFGSIWDEPLGHGAGGVLRLPARHGRRRRVRASCSARTATSPTCSARTSRSSTRSRASSSARSSSSRSGSACFPKVLLAAVLVFFVVFFNAFQGVREVDPNLVANVRVLGASPLQVARHVTIPSAMTWIIASLHTAFGFAIIGALVGEVLGAQHGIGLIISQAQGNFDPNTVFACMVIMAVVTLGGRVPHHPAREARPAAVAAAEPLRSRRPSEPSSLHRRRRHHRHPRKEHSHEQAHHRAVVAAAGIVALGLAACSGAAATSSSGSTRQLGLPTVKMMVGGIDKQIYLPYQLAQSLGYYKKYGVNMRALDRAERRRRRRGRDGLRPGRHGRRLVHPHDRLPVQGQGRHQPRAALRRPRRARDVQRRQRRALGRRLQGQDDGRDRPRLRHRRADPVPGGPEGRRARSSTTPSPCGAGSTAIAAIQRGSRRLRR